ncbi:hypothetical protein BDN72DRAFT_963808 [Pluteus cervinus]|uniref:Uncharacterized protein n=1 Tax=Pluteus cervinus TaxID=181527 RepID=A0ACD3AFH0_9AGAR|nr:hypothetical protein BDN72DRAFT_963808 [Pluteus cervinus]
MARSSPSVYSFDILHLTPKEAFQKIDTEICTIQAYLHSLQSLRNSLTPTSQIPIEILSKIFSFCQDYGEPSTVEHVDFTTRLSISQVCKHWRATALSTPDLWTMISISERSNKDFIQELITRSGSSNLSINVVSTSPSADVLAIDPPALPRIQHMRLEYTSGEEAVLLIDEVFEQAAPILSSLALSKLALPINLPPFSTTYPQLRSLTLCSCLSRNITPLMTPTLTRLHISRPNPCLPVSQFLAALVTLRNLEEIVFIQCFPYIPAGPHARHIHLPHLNVLDFTESESTLFLFLRCLDNPQALVNITYLEDGLEDDFLQALESYLSDTALPLHHLTIFNNGKDLVVDISTAALQRRHHIYLPNQGHELPEPNNTTRILEILNLTDLETLSITELSKTSLEEIAALSKLTSLTLVGSLMLLEMFTTLASSKPGSGPNVHFPQLRHLILSNIELTPRHNRNLSRALSTWRKGGRGLELLKFVNCANADRAAFVGLVDVVVFVT